MTGTGTISRGCNRSEDMTSFILSNVTCGVNYDITVIPFNRLGDGPARLVEFPGIIIHFTSCFIYGNKIAISVILICIVKMLHLCVTKLHFKFHYHYKFRK